MSFRIPLKRLFQSETRLDLHFSKILWGKLAFSRISETHPEENDIKRSLNHALNFLRMNSRRIIAVNFRSFVNALEGNWRQPPINDC